MREVEWQRKFCERIKSEGWFADKWSTQFKAGPPDLVVVIDGHAIFIEVKVIRTGGKEEHRKVPISLSQLHYLNKLRSAGTRVGVMTVWSPNKGLKNFAVLALHPLPWSRHQGLINPFEDNSWTVNVSPFGGEFVWPPKGAKFSEYLLRRSELL